MKTNSFSFKAILISITLFVCAFFYAKHGKESYTFYGDALGYYLYLPSAFIYHNFNQIEVLPTDKHIEQPVLDYVAQIPNEFPKSPTGHYIDQYTYGVAFLELPFFGIAHFYEKWKGLDANGFSVNYHLAIKLCTLFYGILGLILLYKILRNYFNANYSLLGVCIILIGTNFFWFVLFQSGMAHIPLFFLYALLFYSTIEIHKSFKTKHFILAGLSAGMITIIRPTDALCLLIPLLYSVYNKETFFAKIKIIKNHIPQIIIATFFFSLCILPQLLFWKKYTGSFLFYSYGKQSFFWLHPQIYKGLFSAVNGWFMYTPIMLLAIAGIFFYKKMKSISVLLFVFLPIYIYIIYSWHCWAYINGLGSRPMIHLYPLLCIPLLFFIQYFFSKSIISKVGIVFITLLLTAVNISYSFQMARGDLWSENSSKTFNINTMFRSKITYQNLVELDVNQTQPNYNLLKTIQVLGKINFADSANTYTDSLGNKYLQNNQNEEFPPFNIEYTFKEPIKKGKYFLCKGEFFLKYVTYDLYKNASLILEIKRGDETILWKGVKINNKIGLHDSSYKKEIHLHNFETNTWGEVLFCAKINANEIQANDKAKLYIWNTDKQEMKIKNLSLEIVE